MKSDHCIKFVASKPLSLPGTSWFWCETRHEPEWCNRNTKTKPLKCKNLSTRVELPTRKSLKRQHLPHFKAIIIWNNADKVDLNFSELSCKISLGILMLHSRTSSFHFWYCLLLSTSEKGKRIFPTVYIWGHDIICTSDKNALDWNKFDTMTPALTNECTFRKVL